jgi:antitoxin HicB
MAQEFTYPVDLLKEEDGIVATLPDFPEVFTQGEDQEEAIGAAADALDEAVAGRIKRGDHIPEPSVIDDRPSVSVSPTLAAKAALHRALRDASLTQSSLAAKLGCDEREVRRLLDPRHPSKMPRLQEAIGKLDQELTVDIVSFRRVEITQAKATTYRGLEIHAELVAELLFPRQIKAGGPVPVIDALRQADRLQPLLQGPYPIEAKPNSKLQEEGATEFKRGKLILQLRKDVWEGAENGIGRYRFTAAHELAHALRHAGELTRGGGRAFRDSTCTASEKLPPNVPIYESPEWQANAWAGAFLLPFGAVRAYMATLSSDVDFSLTDFAKHFQVSTQAAEIRLQKLVQRFAHQAPPTGSG